MFTCPFITSKTTCTITIFIITNDTSLKNIRNLLLQKLDDITDSTDKKYTFIQLGNLLKIRFSITAISIRTMRH